MGRTVLDGWGSYDDVDDEDSTPGRKHGWLWVATAAVVIALLAIGYVVLRKGDNTADSGATAPTSAVASAPAEATSAAASSATLAPTSVVTTVGPSTNTETTTAAATTSTVPATTPPAAAAAPILAIFSADGNTLSGAVPDQASKGKLQALMIAYSKTPVPLKNLLAVDPTVPIGIGVRLVELTSAPFQPGSAVVQGAHALELDRAVALMNALPNITALVIGHADQVGTSGENGNLAAARATAVVNYLVSKGVSPSRLPSRAVNDTDVTALNDDAASAALNGRTEFVLYGLLAP
jgi:outer membrane protein OmpA-like peptidoglycan-associated protein